MGIVAGACSRAGEPYGCRLVLRGCARTDPRAAVRTQADLTLRWTSLREENNPESEQHRDGIRSGGGRCATSNSRVEPVSAGRQASRQGTRSLNREDGNQYRRSAGRFDRPGSEGLKETVVLMTRPGIRSRLARVGTAAQEEQDAQGRNAKRVQRVCE